MGYNEDILSTIDRLPISSIGKACAPKQGEIGNLKNKHNIIYEEIDIPEHCYLIEELKQSETLPNGKTVVKKSVDSLQMCDANFTITLVEAKEISNMLRERKEDGVNDYRLNSRQETLTLLDYINDVPQKVQDSIYKLKMLTPYNKGKKSSRMKNIDSYKIDAYMFIDFYSFSIKEQLPIDGVIKVVSNKIKSVLESEGISLSFPIIFSRETLLNVTKRSKIPTKTIMDMETFIDPFAE